MLSIPPKTFFKTVEVKYTIRPIRTRKRKRPNTTMEDSKEGADSMMIEVGSKREHSHLEGQDADGFVPPPHKRQDRQQKMKQKKQQSKNKKRKTRVHPQEAGHSIKDLPSVSPPLTESSDAKPLDGKEIAKQLGLQISGTGKGAEIWFIGPKEGDEEDQDEDEWKSALETQVSRSASVAGKDGASQ